MKRISLIHVLFERIIKDSPGRESGCTGKVRILLWLHGNTMALTLTKMSKCLKLTFTCVPIVSMASSHCWHETPTDKSAWKGTLAFLWTVSRILISAISEVLLPDAQSGHHLAKCNVGSYIPPENVKNRWWKRQRDGIPIGPFWCMHGVTTDDLVI